MEPSDISIEILRSIQRGIAGLREDMNARFAEHGERLVALERHAAVTNETLAKLHDDITITNETLGVIRERLVFVEAAAGVATDGRQRLGERVDRLEARVDALEEQGEPKAT